MKIRSELVSKYTDNKEDKFARFLSTNGFRSILLSNRTYSTILYRGNLSLYGKLFLSIAEHAGVSLEDLQEYMLSHTVSVQTLMSLKGRELVHADMESIQREFILQKFSVVSDSTIQELKQTSQYIESKALEDKLNKKYDKLCDSVIPDMDPGDCPIPWFLAYVFSILTCSFMAYATTLDMNAVTTGMIIGTILPTLVMIYVFIILSIRPSQIRELRYRYATETYGHIIESFSE